MSFILKKFKDALDFLPNWGKVAIGTAFVGGTIFLVLGRKKGKKGPYKKDYMPNMVYVYQFPRASAIPSISPFALKLETWLRMAGVEYQNVETPLWVRSSEGTLPFVELNGTEYVDSSFIIRDLTKILDKTFLDGSLSNEQLAISRSFQQMVEASTFISYGYFRYREQLDQMFKKGMAFPVPFLWRLIMPMWLVQRRYQKRFDAFAIARHSREEIVNIGLDDLRSISAYLGPKDYFHGDFPTVVDAFLFSVLAQMVYIPIDSPHRTALLNDLQNLVRYCDRMKARFWPDWDEICKTRALNTWKK